MPPRSDFRTQRLFVETALSPGSRIPASRDQANYLLNVLRLDAGAPVLLFNGQDGEWRAHIEPSGRKACTLIVSEQTRPQTPPADLDYLFAPLKHARLDYMVQKAVEMGAGRLRPVITRHTQASRVNLERMEANAVEAAEQCGVLALPRVCEPVKLDSLLGEWPQTETTRRILFCDEGEASSNPRGILEALPRGPLAVLIGPEGGFSQDERAQLRGLPFVTAIPLGPRILRADTAAVAALSVVQMMLGDWV